MSSHESNRPHYHFTPPSMWLNDPNGLVYANGEYHLFYQHHPESTIWGPMHWGHATSRDLVDWQHQPIALSPDQHGMIFSGCAIVDWHNSAGFGEAALVAIFTHHQEGVQRQSLAYSVDSGSTWIPYANNPVLEPPPGFPHFRDPKVFWDDEHGGHWVMSLAAGDRVQFYTSPNLKDWQLSGEFGVNYGAHAGVWETPDLFKLPIEGTTETRWVLSLGIGDGGPAGGSGSPYFIGEFDGATFHSENPPETTLWADFGADFYAAQSWSDEPNGRRIWVGWLNNWQYANKTPATTWRGAFSIPRMVSLACTEAGIRIRQQPIPELEQLRSDNWFWPSQLVIPGTNLLAEVALDTAEINAEFEIGTDTHDFGLRVFVGATEYTTIGYSIHTGQLYVDRTHSGDSSFHPAFARRHVVDLAPIDGRIRLRIFIDHSSVEVFANDGILTLTDQVFPSEGSVGLELFAEGGPVVLSALDVYRM